MLDSNPPRTKYRSPDRREMRALCHGTWLPRSSQLAPEVSMALGPWLPLRERRKLNAALRAERLRRVRG